MSQLRQRFAEEREDADSFPEHGSKRQPLVDSFDVEFVEKNMILTDIVSPLSKKVIELKIYKRLFMRF